MNGETPPKPWKCNWCDRQGECDFCEACGDHCLVQKADDPEAHRHPFASVCCSVDPKERSN